MKTIDSDLPEGLKPLARTIIKKSKLIRREKQKAESELTQEMQALIDEGHSEEEILAKYEKPKRRARQFKRQARRKRQPLWHLYIWFWRGCLSSPVFYIAFAIYLANGKIVPTVDYLAKINAPAAAVPEADRAWPIYRDAINKHRFHDFDTNTIMTEGRYYKQDDGEYWDKALDALNSYKPFLAAIRQGAQRAGMGLLLEHSVEDYSEVDGRAIFYDYDEMIKQRTATSWHPEDETIMHDSQFLMDFPPLGWGRRAVQLLIFENELALNDQSSNANEFVTANIFTAIKFACHIGESNHLVGHLVYISIRKLVYAHLCQLIYEHPNFFTDKQLITLEQLLKSPLCKTQSNLAVEKPSFDDMLQRLYCTNGYFNQRSLYILFCLGELLETDEKARKFSRISIPFLPIISLSIANRKEMTAKHDELWDMMIAYEKLPFWEQLNQSSGVDEALDQITEKFRTAFKYAPLKLLMPMLDQASHFHQCQSALRESTLITIALARYHRAEQRYPESLEALSPDYLSFSPIDHCSGKSLIYRLENGQPLLYSTGVDGDDDGGRISENNLKKWPRLDIYDREKDESDGDWVIWPKPE